MNILIKLTCLIGLVIAPILGQDMAVAETPVIDEVTMHSSQDNQESSFPSTGLMAVELEPAELTGPGDSSQSSQDVSSSPELQPGDAVEQDLE